MAPKHKIRPFIDFSYTFLLSLTVGKLLLGYQLTFVEASFLSLPFAVGIMFAVNTYNQRLWRTFEKQKRDSHFTEDFDEF